jgi:mediator of RNA polymerase II transcription subunit 17, fungi type
MDHGNDLRSLASVALGEMSHARDLLESLLSTSRQSTDGPLAIASNATPSNHTSSLTATVVAKPSSIPSVEAFNAQLVVGGKDEALRKASDLLRSEARDIEKTRQRGEKYWVDALKIRADSWNLIPAPLPFGSATAKSSERTSKDFLITYGLEECGWPCSVPRYHD